MPTPIGHAIAAVAAGWMVAHPARDRRALVIQVVAFGALGVAPDLDLLINRHRGMSHSIGMAAIAATVVALVQVPVAGTRARIWLAAWAAWATHALLDALALDRAAPLGLMAFWPFSREYFQTGLEVFAPVSRAIRAPTFLPTAIIALTRELLILAPIVYAVWRWRRPPSAAPGTS